MIATRVWRAGLTLALILAAALLLVAPPERCPSVTASELRGSAQATVDWFVRNQDADGSWLYLYDAEEDSSTSEYNEVRHAGVTMGLYQAAAAGLPGASGSADRGTQWALDRLVERDGWAALAYSGEVTTGATALLAAGLTIRREATGDRRYDGLLGRLGRFLLAQTEPSGAVLASYDLCAGRRSRASTPSTTRGRPTGPSPASTGRSRTRAGARRRIGSAPTWRAGATRPRVTGRRSRITGPPTAPPRPSSSRNEGAAR